ncbi:MAG TPA: hypothetical protein VLL52_00690 [Anaerolineae bacterium]|nr:hypothetical protein [Anaerolineae bacterium]
MTRILGIGRIFGVGEERMGWVGWSLEDSVVFWIRAGEKMGLVQAWTAQA